MTTPTVTAYQITVPVADLVDKPARTLQISRNSSQMLYGETLDVIEEQGDWVRGTCATDGYEGWVHKSQLKPLTHFTTHFVDLPWTHIYPEPDFKTRPVMGVGFLSRLTVNPDIEKNGFVSIPGTGWIYARHIKPLSAMNGVDPVYTVMRFLGCPYLYGGRTAMGIDCSGLTQLALNRAGVYCPRDSGPQEKSLGTNVPRAQAQRGDLVFFPGHVGIMIDDQHVVNASARTMCIEVERLDDLDRIYSANGKPGIISIRRVNSAPRPAPGTQPLQPGE
ncbi:MAG: C40 family peptidase [Alphaproteobacteria bacterium]|nr:C40 family peptidase [Alphaproteobacteria bacterium]